MQTRLIIIGGGVVGLSTAYYAARQGFEVTMLDERPESHEGCSYGNAGLVVPSHYIPLAAPGMVALGLKWMWNPESPFYIKPRLDADLISWALKFWAAATPENAKRAGPFLRDINFAGRACFEEFAALPGADFNFETRGLLALCKTQRALDEEAHTAEGARQLGMPAEVLDARQTAALDPNVTMDIAGAVYFPEDCHLSPARFMALLKREVARLGVKTIWNCEATGLIREGAKIKSAQTDAGEIEADEFVIATGSWSPRLAKTIGLKLPMQAGKGYSVTLPNPRQLPAIPSIFTEARVAVTPMGNSLRFGGTMEIAGLNENINPRRVQGIIKAVPKYYPQFTPNDFQNIQPWCGLRPCSPDGLPYIGRTARAQNLTLATGHAMMGLSLGPVTGKLVAEILTKQKPSLDLTLVNPDRYA